MKAKNVIEKELCSDKCLFGSFESTKEKPYWNGVVMKEIFKTYGLNYNANNVIDCINNTIPPEVFKTSREATINSQLLVKKMIRLREYIDTLPEYSKPGTKLFASNTVTIAHNITVDYSFMLVDGDEVRIFKVKNKKNTQLKSGGRSKFTRVSESMELYLLQLAGEKLYPNAYVTAGIIFLTHPDDKNENLVPTIEFNNKKDSNVVKHHFLMTQRAEMNKRVDDIINDRVCDPEQKCLTCVYNDICNFVSNDVQLKVINAKAKASGKVKFTKHQQEVIGITDGVYRVLAGAGSGKTTCIANRIVELAKSGVDVRDVLLITFTNKGVEEMKEKIQYWLKVNGINVKISDLNIFTFNSFGYELIKQEYKNLGFTDVPKLFDKSENLDLIKSLLDSNPEIPGYNYANPFMDMRYAKGAVYQMAQSFETLKTEDIVMPEDAEAVLNVSLEVAEAVLDLYNQYKNYMKANNYIDYNDQVMYCYQILSDKKNLKKYGFEHIICDEFQDSDNLQINILMLLKSYPYNRSLMVVGDDSQAIYSWRGATSQNILNFHKYFRNSVDLQLVENFRSTKEICNLANEINAINTNKIDKDLVGVSHGDKPILQSGSVEDMVQRIIDDIKTQNIDYSDIAIIARNKNALLKARQLLIENNIPATLSISELLIDNQSVKHMVDFMKFVCDNTLDLYFVEYLQVLDSEEFNKQKSSGLFYKYIEDEKTAFLDAYNLCVSDEEKMNFILDKFEKVAQKNRAIESLLEIIKEKNLTTVDDLSKFLHNMILYKSDYVIEKIEDPVDAVTLTTAHSSKGREWKHVYINLDDFKYPTNYNYYSSKNNTEVEEERRLVFVAITRAKEKLTMFGKKSSLFDEIAVALGIKKAVI